MKTSYENGIYFSINHKITTFKTVKYCDNKSCDSSKKNKLDDNYCSKCGEELKSKEKESKPRYQYHSEIAEFANLMDVDCISENQTMTNEEFYNFNCSLEQFNNPKLNDSEVLTAINSFERTKDTYQKLKKAYGDKLTLFCGHYETFN